jgi:hypothetical protein
MNSSQMHSSHQVESRGWEMGGDGEGDREEMLTCCVRLSCHRSREGICSFRYRERDYGCSCCPRNTESVIMFVGQLAAQD